ncbi:MerR family transcriptional regulator [Anaerotignum sp.]|uniref:MerR family transcriptional regulator n=1 Tax=Anaerotignum sp. TaxID=2039241 RepID=UPI002714A5E7|nr:MerR family transcriptional regulator [Anaerotignum sp.]
MEYGIKELSELAGVSSRTLRYYDEIGLLLPSHTNDAGYRFYGEKEVELLQQILFYRERGFGLEQIRNILYQTDFDILSALYGHLQELENQKKRVDDLICIVKKTILSKKGEVEMSDRERFDVLKEEIIQENEERYGKEVREKYGNGALEETNKKILDMTEGEYEHLKNLENEILFRLKEVVIAGKQGESAEGKNIVLLHKEWLKMTWKGYSLKGHKALTEMYLMDERFTAYYDREVKGCAEFLKKAVDYWIEKL